ncbi:putative UPF0481 protein At3g02645 [Phragmites australis]|uniref:putative UPF0481 protein At3g02645 n=1 Tax=Phragmites australis TaxID=29695 RepID=UPI002D79BD9B|nr:putative UPF0481 protein At3g02645 [Phragmites australis]
MAVSAANACLLQLDNEEHWLHRVRQSLERDTAEELGTAAKVLDVPRTLRDTKPELYAPHRFALGPYHQARADLMGMERYKLAAAKRVEKLFTGDRKIDQLVQRFLGLVGEIRVMYHRFLEINDLTLAWMMAIDTCFMLDFLENYHREETTDMVSSATNWINSVVRDSMMLENQIPLFLFAKTLELRNATELDADNVVPAVFDRFIKNVSPIKIKADLPIGDLGKHAHLLDLLYHFLVPNATVYDESSGGQDRPGRFQEVCHDDLEKQELPDYDKVKQACVRVCSLNVAPVRFLKKNLISRPMSLVSNLSGKITRKVPVLAALVPAVGKLMQSVDVTELLEGMNLGGMVNSPLMAHEIKIPSVEQLVRCGVRFVPAQKGIAGIAFDGATATLSLPAITLDGNTEVILRNLVAYEAVAVRGPLVLARYTELMNGIIDTGKDVKILQQSRVVTNQMKSDKEAAGMWNGMCRAMRLSKVPRLDGVIRAVNVHRNKNKAVRAKKLLKKYVFGSWRMLTLLASVVLLLMTALQTFCSAYPCKDSWFGSLLELPLNQDGK